MWVTNAHGAIENLVSNSGFEIRGACLGEWDSGFCVDELEALKSDGSNTSISTVSSSDDSINSF